MLGERKYYIQDKSKLINIFDFDTSITDSHYHLLRILNYLNRRINARSRLARGYVNINQLIFASEEVSIRREIILDSLLRLAHFNLIEFDNQSRDRIETTSHIKITYSGIHYLQELLFEFIYLDSILVDTPISDDSTYSTLKNHIDDTDLNKRLQRTQAFINYLHESENREFSDHPEYLGYELTNRRFGAELFEKFPQIKTSVLSSADNKINID